ncbi:MAG: hypothetical protein AAF098_15540 [Pseudomonadota bacterium]
MSNLIQKACIWSGPVFALIMLVSFLLLGFIPPLPAALDASEVAQYYEDHRLVIRIGGTLVMQASVLMMLWIVAISMQLRRIEVGPPVLSTLQVIFGSCGNFLFILVSAAWSLAAFRPEREATEIQAFNDLGWFLLLMPATLLTAQALCIGVLILIDQRETPLFKRWVGYFNIWIAILFLPGALITFFKTGPFSWDGILVFWLALTLFLSWLFVMAVAVSKAIDSDT